MMTKSNVEIFKTCTDIFQGKALLENAVWLKVLQSLYQQQDIDALSILIKNKSYLSRMRTEEERSKSRDGKRIRGRLAQFQQTQVPQPTKISYFDFLDVILHKQLCDHLAFLTNFMQLFQEFDSDQDGIICS